MHLSERDKRREDDTFAALTKTRPQLVGRVADAGGAVEPNRAVVVPEHDPEVRVGIDRYPDFGIECVTLERTVTDTGIRLIFQKAAVLDGEPRKAGAKQEVGLDPGAGQEEKSSVDIELL